MAFQVSLDLYLNRTTFRQYFSMKKLLWRKDFAVEPPGGHQWEVGYRNYPLRVWEHRLEDSGWSIRQARLYRALPLGLSPARSEVMNGPPAQPRSSARNRAAA